MHKDRFTTLVGIDYPIIQAPMAGGATTPELVAAVSNAGGFGFLAGAMLSPQSILDNARRIRELTERPFGINLFVLEHPDPGMDELTIANQRLAPYREALGLEPATPLDRYCEDPRAQMEALIEAAPAAASFTFGVHSAALLTRLKRAQMIVIGTATTVDEAKAWRAVGAECISVQGSEAGAHRGTFLDDFEQSCIGLMALVPQVVNEVDIPVLAAGGIMDGRGIAASLVLGADAAQLGTAFLCCPESGIHSGWKNAIRNTNDHGTRMTRTFSGKYARGIVNRFMQDLRSQENQIPAYPVQNALTGEIRKAAAQQNNTEFLSLWAGQGAPLARTLPAAKLVRQLARELEQSLAGFSHT